MQNEKVDIIRKLFAAYLANDRAAIEAVFTDDFTFTSPFDDAIDRATYFATCWRAADWVADHDLMHVVVDGDTAFANYRCVSKDGRSFRNTELFRFTGDRIRAIEVYFGATYRDGAFQKQMS